jgi:hypothetical protein
MRRIGLAVVLALSLFLSPLGTDAQQTYREAPNRMFQARKRRAVEGSHFCRATRPAPDQ